jgi:thiamine biosynthesis lipoprotein ApbE
MLTVSVIGPSSAETDALSTAFFVMGRKRTEEFCRSHPNLRVIIIEESAQDGVEVTRIGFD